MTFEIGENIIILLEPVHLSISCAASPGASNAPNFREYVAGDNPDKDAAGAHCLRILIFERFDYHK
jgi:hypothetical protein